MRGVRWYTCFALSWCFAPLWANPDIPAEEDSARLYRTPAEQREAGLQHPLGPWLTASGLAEFDWDAKRISYSRNLPRDWNRERSANLQLGFTATPWEPLTGELVLEYDTDDDRLQLDEATAGIEMDAIELVAGKQYSPFGVYFNHFASDALLEFAETRDTGLTLSYDFDERFDVSFLVYHGRARDQDHDGARLDWALAMEAAFNDVLTFGVSYQADLADADSRLLVDTNDRYQRQVAGLGGFLLWTSGHFEISAEALGALRTFQELESDRNRPWAWNLEFAHYLHPKLDWALRLEGSNELEDAPELRYGAALSLRLGKQASLTLDYLRGRYRNDFVRDDGNNAYAHEDRLAAKLSIAF